MLNVAATLQQRCGNVLTTSDSDVVTTSETDVGTTLIFDCATTLSQRRCASWAYRSNLVNQLTNSRVKKLPKSMVNAQTCFSLGWIMGNIFSNDQANVSAKFFIHSFSIYSHKKAINVYMLTCSEAVPRRCSHETGAPKKKDLLRRTDPKCFTTDIAIK